MAPICVLLQLLLLMTLSQASGPSMPYEVVDFKERATFVTTAAPARAPGTCPQPSEELMACMRQWACQQLIRLDLRCLLNLNGLPLIGNALGGLLGGGGGAGGTGGAGGAAGAPGQPGGRPALGGPGGGILGGPGGGLLGGAGGILGGLLG